MTERDRAGLADCLSPEAVVWLPPTCAAHNQRPEVGRDAVLKVFIGGGQQRIAAGSQQWHHQHVLAAGDVVVVHSTMTCTTTGGLPYENVYVWLFRCEQGRIAEVWEHLDTLYALTYFEDYGAIIQCIRSSGGHQGALQEDACST